MVTRIAPSPAREGRSEAAGEIVITGLTKDFRLGWRSTVRALDRFDLTVAAGEFVAILGPSGCGKSTVLRTVAGLEEPSTGTITIGGRAPHETVAEHRVGVALQENALLPWLNVRKNLEVPFRLSRRKPDAARIQELIELVGLNGFEDARPRQLSGGMRQRVSIARALALQPEVLMLDEPFGALDAVTRQRMNLELARIWAETSPTTILVTHDVAEAVFLADRVVVMTGRPGRVLEVQRVEFDHPRDRAITREPEFHRLVDRFTDLLVQPDRP
ncbi:ABC transporter ATP-binding protein [Tsukamurella sp. NPDC003166]|uniref:ABC transporter ATP-binding protein n=1 Tax=Tsukamurella sp. NPDC003166 TaxID=3154444 RepID=UPI00339FDD1C